MLLKPDCRATCRSDQIRSGQIIPWQPCPMASWRAVPEGPGGGVTSLSAGTVSIMLVWFAPCHRPGVGRMCLGCLPLLFIQPPAHPSLTVAVGSQGWSHSVTPLQNWRGRGWGPPLWSAPLKQGEGELCWKGQHHSAFPVLHGILVGLCVSSAAVTCSASANPLVTVYCMFEGCKPYNLSAFTVAFRIKWLPSTLSTDVKVCRYCKWSVRFPPLKLQKL